MLIKILLAVVVIVIVLAVFIATRPADFRLVRGITIAAPPAAAFAQVNDFHKWQGWSPWEGRDPNMQRNYSGAPEGTGAVYGWVGNKEVGEGRMTIEESRAPEQIRIKLEFIKPWTATNVTLFTFKAEGGQTQVTWSMTGSLDFMGKAFHLVMNMEKLVGGDFEKGLAKLKTLAEAASK